MTEAFLDTTILIGKITKRSTKVEQIFKDPDVKKYTNEYVLKEMYHVLRKQYKYSELEIGYAMDYIREKCTILPMPKREEILQIKICSLSTPRGLLKSHFQEVGLPQQNHWLSPTSFLLRVLSVASR